MPVHTPITLNRPTPNDPPRPKSLGASESSVLFEQVALEDPVLDSAHAEGEEETGPAEDGQHVSPYTSLYQLAMTKSGRYTPPRRPDTQRQKFGRVMEPIIIQMILDDKQWVGRAAPYYYMHPSVPRKGAQIDYEVLEGGEAIPLEIKLVSDNERWKWINAAGVLVVPMHIQMQAQHQMAVTGTPKVYIGVLFGTSDLNVLEVLRDDEMIADIEAAVTEFWHHVENDEIPEPDPVRDGRILRKMYTIIHPQGRLDWSDDTTLQGLVSAWREAAADERAAKSTKERIRDELTEHLNGNAMADLGSDYIIKLTYVAPTNIPATTREGYHRLSVTKAPKQHAGRPRAAS